MPKEKNGVNEVVEEEYKRIQGWSSQIDESRWNQSLLRILEKKITLHESEEKQKRKTIKKNSSQTLPSVSDIKLKKSEVLEKEEKISTSNKTQYKKQQFKLKTQSEPFRQNQQIQKQHYIGDQRLKTELLNVNQKQEQLLKYHTKDLNGKNRNKHVQSHDIIRIPKPQNSPEKCQGKRAQKCGLKIHTQDSRTSLDQISNQKQKEKTKGPEVHHKKSWKDYLLPKKLQYKKKVTWDWIHPSPKRIQNQNHKKIILLTENYQKTRAMETRKNYQYSPFRMKKEKKIEKLQKEAFNYPIHKKQKTQAFMDDHLQTFRKKFVNLEEA